MANIYCDCKQIKNKEELSVKFYQSFFVMWFQNWFKSNKDTFPDAIIIYREGLNEVQAKKELAVEIEALKETLLLLPIKAKIEKYFP